MSYESVCAGRIDQRFAVFNSTSGHRHLMRHSRRLIGSRAEVWSQTSPMGVETITNTTCSIHLAKSDYDAAQTPDQR
jgi:hypothetical protein